MGAGFVGFMFPMLPPCLSWHRMELPDLYFTHMPQGAPCSIVGGVLGVQAWQFWSTQEGTCRLAEPGGSSGTGSSVQ